MKKLTTVILLIFLAALLTGCVSVLIVPTPPQGRLYVDHYRLCLGDRGNDMVGNPLSDVCGEDVPAILGVDE